MKALTYLMLFVSMAAFAEEATYAAARAAMVEELRLYAQILDDPDEARISDAVMTSMGTVKRHELVPQQESRFAYENRPLPIGWSIVRRGLVFHRQQVRHSTVSNRRLSNAFYFPLLLGLFPHLSRTVLGDS